MLIIDGTYLVYKSFYITKKIKESNSIEDENHYVKVSRNMFLKSVAKLKNKYEEESLFIVFDSEIKNFRNEIMPSYKSNRKEKPKELIKIKNEIYSFLELHNFPFQIAEDYEGDDLIASFIEKNKGKEINIFTGDADLSTLVDKNVTLLLEKKSKIHKVTNKNFHHFFPVPAKKIPIYKALQGDKSDNIKGIEGLISSEVIHLLMEYNNMEEYFQKGQEHYLYEKLKKNEEKIVNNLKLTNLKFDCQINYKWENLRINRIYIPEKIDEKINWNIKKQHL